MIQNDYFAYFKTTPHKSRKNFLELLQGVNLRYVLDEISYNYLKTMGIRLDIISILLEHKGKEFSNINDWNLFLNTININGKTTGKNILRSLEEAALLGGAVHAGVNLNAIFMSDNAPQFKKIFFFHALCWIHMIRSISKIVPMNKKEATEIDCALDLIWAFYQKLKAYKEAPDDEKKQKLTEEFDKIFEQSTISQELLIVFKEFRRYKKSLLYSLDYIETPLHNNSSENDIRSAVIKRKISGPTRSDKGLIRRDTGLTIIALTH